MQSRVISLVGVVLTILAPTVFAHSTEGVAGGFISGVLHPLFGLDHLVAMVAVGLWGAFLGDRAVWLLPVVFPSVMAIGAVAGILGVQLGFVEVFIALSGVVLGAFIVLGYRAPLWLALIFVGLFAIFHGYAHGLEMPAESSAAAYGAGFVLATGALHAAGIAIGFLTRFERGLLAVRATGAAISVIGLTFLV